MPNRDRRPSNLPVVLATVLCVGLTGFAYWWQHVRAVRYDDSDPMASFGSILFLFLVPGLMLCAIAVPDRLVRRERSADSWSGICWVLTIAYGAVAVLVALALA